VPAPHPSRQSGWGLFLVDRMADRWGVDRSEGTRVWFELEREGAMDLAHSAEAV